MTLVVDEVLEQRRADKALAEANAVSHDHAVEAVQRPQRALDAVALKVGERHAAGLARRERLVVAEQVELVLVELEQGPEEDVVRGPGLRLARGEDLDESLAVVLGVPEEVVEPALGRGDHARLVVAERELEVGEQAGLGEVGRAGDHALPAEQIGLAVEELVREAADRDRVAAQEGGEPADVAGGAYGEGERVAVGGELALEALEPLADPGSEGPATAAVRVRAVEWGEWLGAEQEAHAGARLGQLLEGAEVEVGGRDVERRVGAARVGAEVAEGLGEGASLAVVDELGLHVAVRPRSASGEPGVRLPCRRSMGASGARRDDREAVVADAVGEAGVVGHNRVDQIVAGKPDGSDEVDGVECCDARRRHGLGGREHRLVDRDERDAPEELVSGVEDSLPQAEPTQLNTQEAARDLGVETVKLEEDRPGIGFVEQHSPERARVDVEAAQSQARSRRLSAR
jgi:hypothetical protein